MEPYPLVISYIAIESGPVEIVDVFPWKMVDLSIVRYVKLPEGNATGIIPLVP